MVSEAGRICSVMLVLSGRERPSSLDNNWQLVEQLTAPAGDALQVWRIDLTDAAACTERCLLRLAPEERHRADRYRVSQARELFVIGRACVRMLLAVEARVRPEQVSIEVGEHGKPESIGSRINPQSFNVSHCSGMVVIATARSGAVGIDVERVDRGIDVMETARAALHPNELCQLEGIAEPDELRRAFFGCWTRREAVTKADGRGLSLSPPSFEVPVFKANNTEVLINASIGNLGKRYFVTDLHLEDDLVSAVAVETSNCRIDRLIFPLNLLI